MSKAARWPSSMPSCVSITLISFCACAGKRSTPQPIASAASDAKTSVTRAKRKARASGRMWPRPRVQASSKVGEQDAGEQQQQAGRVVQESASTDRDREHGQRQGEHATPHRAAVCARRSRGRRRGRRCGSRLWRHGADIPSNYRPGRRLAIVSCLSYCIGGCGARRRCQPADSPKEPVERELDMSTVWRWRLMANDSGVVCLSQDCGRVVVLK